MDNKLKAALDFDPIDAAEKILGREIKDNDDIDTINFACVMAMSHNAKKDSLLKASNDSYKH